MAEGSELDISDLFSKLTGMRAWPLVEMRGFHLGVWRLQPKGCSGWAHPRRIPGWSLGIWFGLKSGFGTAPW